MYYVKTEIAESVTIQAEITDENVFNLCPKCGAEVAVDLADIVTDDGLDLYGTAIYCEKCANQLKAECEEEERYQKLRSNHREAQYLDDLTMAMEAATKVWDADGITPKEKVIRLQKAFPEFIPSLPPEAFPSEEEVADDKPNKDAYALKKWIPDDENDRIMALMTMYEEYHASLMEFGEDHSATKLQKKLLVSIFNGRMIDHRDDIQTAVLNQVAAYNYSIEDAAEGDEELAAFYRRVLGLSEEG